MLLSLLPVLRQRFDVTLSIPMPGPLVDRAEGMGISTTVLPDYAIRRRHLSARGLLPWLGRLFRSAVSLTRAHRRQRFDIIYSSSLAAGLGSVVKLLWRVPHVLHVHEYPYHGTASRVALLQTVRATADNVVCISDYLKKACAAAVPALTERTTVVHNGIDLTAIQMPGDTAERGPGEPLRVVCVGRINGRKGQEILVDAARRAGDAGLELELHFFGDWLPEDAAMAEALHTKVRASGLDSVTTFHGFVADQNTVYSDADVVVVPSIVPEGFGLTVIEAQARGIPVIAAALGGPVELIDDGRTGLLVPPHDAHALAAALMSLQRGELRSQLGAAGRKRVFEHHGLPAAADRVADLVGQAADGPGAATRHLGAWARG